MKKKRRKGKVLPKPPLPKKTSFIHRLKFLMKKAQTAMEYVLTYGWAVLIILFAISSLFYIGVFEPKTPNTCLIEAPFVCNDVKAYDDTIIYTLNSQNVKTATVTDVLINGQSCSDISELGDLGLIINPSSNSYNINSQNQIICTGLEQDLYQKTSSEIILDYETQQGLQHTISGTSSVNIEGLGSEFILDYTMLNDPGMSLGFNFENGLEVLGGYPGNSPPNNNVSFEQEEILGQVAIFNGINSSIEIGNQPILNPEVITIEFLVKPYSDSLSSARIMVKGYLDGYELRLQYDVGIINEKIVAKIFYFIPQPPPDWGWIGIESGPIEADKWYHIVIVYDGYDLMIYTNGELYDVSSACSRTRQICPLYYYDPINGPLIIGKYIEEGYNYFHGELDSIVIYNRVLSPDEIKKHYEHFTPP